MERIELGDFLLIAESHLGVSANDLARFDRVVAMGSAALAAPFAGFGDYEVFPTFEAKAAVYCCRIVRYHPLPDANKRMAYDVMIEFVERNGRSWRRDHAADERRGVARLAARLVPGAADGLPVGVGMYRLRGQLGEAEEMQRRLGHR